MSNYHNQHGHSYSPKKSRIQRFEKTQFIFLILILIFFSVTKKSIEFNLKTKLCYEFNAKMHVDTQNIKQF